MNKELLEDLLKHGAEYNDYRIKSHEIYKHIQIILKDIKREYFKDRLNRFLELLNQESEDFEDLPFEDIGSEWSAYAKGLGFNWMHDTMDIDALKKLIDTSE